MKPDFILFFAIPFDSATRHEMVRVVDREMKIKR